MEAGRIPNKLKSYRKSVGYSQKKAARMLRLTDTSSLSRWEHGVSVPHLVQVFRLSRMYHTLPHLLYEELWLRIGSEYSLSVQDDEPFSTNHSEYA